MNWRNTLRYSALRARCRMEYYCRASRTVDGFARAEPRPHLNSWRLPTGRRLSPEQYGTSLASIDATGDNHEHAHNFFLARFLHGRSLDRANSRSEHGDQCRETSARYCLQGSSGGATTRNALRGLVAARPLCRPYQVSAWHEGHAPLASRYGSDRLSFVRHILLRRRRTM